MGVDLRQVLVECGLGGLDAATLSDLESFLIDQLEIKIGSILADRMSPFQLEAFEEIHGRGDDAATLAWLDREAPDHRDVAVKQLEILKGELIQRRREILAVAMVS